MKETAKGLSRRLHTPGFATRYFAGQGLDIGGETDPLGQFQELFPLIKSMRIWGVGDGAAQYLTGLGDNSFDFVHASLQLQCMPDPGEAIRHWFRVVRPGGHLILTVPDEDMYEQGVWPSRANHDNRWTFTLFKTKSWSPVSLNLLDLLQRLGAGADIRRLEVVDEGYRFALPRFNQTLTPVAEAAIEIVVRKRPQSEAVAGGRLGRDAPLSPRDVFILTGIRTEPQK